MYGEIVKRILEYMDRKKLTQEEFGRPLLVSRAAVSAWKNGQSSPAADRILEIIRVYGDIDANWLIRGEKLPEAGGISNKMAGKNLRNIQGGGSVSVDSGALWKERYEMACQVIQEKEEQIKLYKKLLNSD